MSSPHATYHSPPRPHLGTNMGGHQQADPTERSRQNQERAMGDHSAHDTGSKAPEDEAPAAQEGEGTGEAEAEARIGPGPEEMEE